MRTALRTVYAERDLRDIAYRIGVIDLRPEIAA